MQCPSCGTSLPETARSCPTCGRAVVSVSPPERGEQPALEHDAPPQPDVAPVASASPVSAPLSQPYYGAPASMPLVGEPPTAPLTRREPFDARRFFIGGIPLWVGILALLAAAATFVYGAFALHKDWADSAWIAAFVALAGVGVILVAGIVVLALRRFQWLTLGLSALLLVALSGTGVYALTNQTAIHRLQARALENNQQWQASIHEYGLAGEQPPAAPNIARVDLEWGEQYYSVQQYREATDRYLQALSDDSSDAAIETRAQKGLYQSYVAWLYANPPDDRLHAIAAFLDSYLANPLCDSDCQKFTRPLAAQAIYLYGEARLKQNSNSFCSRVATDFQDLVSRYAGTEGAQRASIALATPVPVTVYIQDFPAKYIGSIGHLSKHVYPEQLDKVSYISRDYAAPLNAWAQPGIVQAIFNDIPPGRYNFSFDYPPGSQFEFHYWWAQDQPFDPYSAVVPPLCGAAQSFYFGGS
jgi:hypothetical protein